MLTPTPHPAWRRLLELAEPYRRAFERDCDEPRRAQERFLREALASHRATDIGRRYDFAGLTDPAAYAERVPRIQYSDLEADLAAWRAGTPTVCAEPAIATEWTSGSTRAAKAIPYSAAGLEDFRRALFPWLADLCRQAPAVAAGSLYWALSPAGAGAFAERGAAGNDAVYFGPAAPHLLSLSAAPLAISLLDTVEAWRFWTCLFLAAREDLALISIWSPTFLPPLLDTLEQEAERLIDCLDSPWRHRVPTPLAEPLRQLGARGTGGARRLRAAVAAGRLDPRILWPNLVRLSCWTHGAAARYVAALSRRLPGVTIEPKGLLSTEAAASIPMHGAPAPVAAVASAFLELGRDDGVCRPLWEWREGDEGVIVVTTRSGLWRYDTGDRVRVAGFWRNAPCLVFLGRAGCHVDLCGEKLDETLVGQRLPAGLDAFLAPEGVEARRYLLFLDARQVAAGEATAVAARVDAALREIVHYRHARELGQLDAVQAVRVAGLLEAVARRGREHRGAPLSAVKTPALDGDTGWLAYFVERDAIED